MLVAEQSNLRGALHQGIKISIENLCIQLASQGVDCEAIAWYDGEGNAILPFESQSPALNDAATQIVARTLQERQLSIGRDGGDAYLVGYPVLSVDNKVSHVFVIWVESVSEPIINLLRLAMGWLHLPFVQQAAERGSEAIHLLDLQAHVFSQGKARSGAQEWVNRLAQLLRANPGDAGRQDVPCSVLYFRVLDRGSVAPRWWVTSDTAWAEQGAAELHAASDAAARAAVEFRELLLADIWAFPVLDGGEIVGVLVVSGPSPDEAALAAARASASVIGPLLTHWHNSERGVWTHALAALRDIGRKLREPGFLTWKVGAVLLFSAMGFLLFVPFDDHAAAKVVVEGQTQQMITAPFEGYWAEVLVRPGDHVKLGQVMARLDTRDLKVEQEKLLSERDQSSGKLRQAFADGDSSAVQQASAQFRQADAELSLVQTKLHRAEITAPADGAVIFGDWHDQIGSPIESGKKMFEIAAGDGYRVVLQVPEEEIARVSLGQSGQIRVTGLPQKQFDFRVNRVTAVAALDDHKNTFRVEARLSDPNAPLRPGMQGVGKIVVAKSNLMTIWMRPVAQWLRMKLWSMWW